MSCAALASGTGLYGAARSKSGRHPPARPSPTRPPAWPARPIIACLHGAGAQLGSIVDELLEEIVSGLGMDDAEEILSCHGAH